MNSNKNTFNIELDLSVTSLSHIIDIICDMGDFAIIQNKYYVTTTLNKDEVIKNIKQELSEYEQVLVKQTQGIGLFQESEKTDINKKISFKEASDEVIKRINNLMDDVKKELESQVSQRKEG